MGSRRRSRCSFRLHQMNLGQGLGGDPLGQIQVVVFSFSGPVKGGHRRGGRTQDHRGLGQLPPVQGGIPGLVGQSPFVFIGRVMFFIHHDKTQVGNRSKYG